MKLLVIFIIFEYLSAIALGIGAVYLVTSVYNDYFYSILFSIMLTPVSIAIGVSIPGYFYLRRKNRLNEFWGSAFLSLLGAIVFIVIDLFINGFLPNKLGFLLGLLPVTGAIGGFNFKNKTIDTGTNKFNI